MHISGQTIKSMVRTHRVTIAALAGRLGITQKRVRQVRERGLDDYLRYCDWHEAITGINIFNPDHPR